MLIAFLFSFKPPTLPYPIAPSPPLPVAPSPRCPLSPSPPLSIAPSLHRMKKPASRVFDRSKGLEFPQGFLQKINLHCVKLLSTISFVRKSIGY